MLELEARGEIYTKAEFNAKLRDRVSRSKKSIEFKHENISAVLDEFGLPWIEGYKPKRNVQQLLREVVCSYVEQQAERVAQICESFGRLSEGPKGSSSTGLVRLSAPVLPAASQKEITSRNRVRLPRKFNFAEQDARNKKLGRAGEECVLNYERQRLTQAQRPDLAARVTWTSDEVGDGPGYDIQSFEPDGSEVFIEVKITNCGASTPFLISRNEVEASEDYGERFRLYRVYDFRSASKFYVLDGPLSATTDLEPQIYRGRPLSSPHCKDIE